MFTIAFLLFSFNPTAEVNGQPSSSPEFPLSTSVTSRGAFSVCSQPTSFPEPQQQFESVANGSCSLSDEQEPSSFESPRSKAGTGRATTGVSTVEPLIMDDDRLYQCSQAAHYGNAPCMYAACDVGSVEFVLNLLELILSMLCCPLRSATVGVHCVFLFLKKSHRPLCSIYLASNSAQPSFVPSFYDDLFAGVRFKEMCAHWQEVAPSPWCWRHVGSAWQLVKPQACSGHFPDH